MSLMVCDGAAGKVFNVGTSEEISVEGLADKIIAMTSSKSEKKYVSYEEAYGKPFDDMLRRVPSLERIKTTIGYEPKMTLEMTLQSVIDEMKNKL